MRNYLILCFLSLLTEGFCSSYDPYHVTYQTIESSVTPDKQKTMIMMHGAGENADYYVEKYKAGEFPKNDDVKIMFLQSGLKQGTRTPWMKTNSGHSHMDPDARNITDANMQSVSIIQIIRDEIKNTYGHLSFEEGAKRIFLAGKSQGALLSLYIQLMKLKTPLGGIGVFSGFPLKPLLMLTYPNVTAAEAQAACPGISKDLRIFVWHGTKDTVFDQKKTFAIDNELFSKLGITKTIKTMYAEEGLTHKTSVKEIEHFMKFIEEGNGALDGSQADEVVSNTEAGTEEGEIKIIQ